MSGFLAELVGTFILVLMGDGVVANVLLKRSKGEGSGWIVITTGWGLAVAFGVYAVGWMSGGHLNPAVTLGLAAAGMFPWDQVVPYIVGQMIGGFLGAVAVYLTYLPHWEVTEDPATKLAVFATAPQIRRSGANLLTEIIGTFMLLLGVGFIFNVNNGLASVWGRWPSASGSGASGSPWAARRGTPSTRPETWPRGSPTPCSPSRARAAPTGATPGSLWWGPSSAGSWAA